MAASERDDAHWDEVDRLWRACRHDLGDAIQTLGDPGGPADHGPRRLSAVAELAKMGREANPDTDAQTLGELVELGEQAIRDDIDQDLEGGL
jgi:hypothetical protein